MASLTSFLFLPYLARSLPVEVYGTYGQTLLIGEFCLALFSIGIGSTLHLQYSENTGEEGTVFKSGMCLTAGMGLLALLLLLTGSTLCAKLFHNPQITGYLRIYAASMLFQLPFMALYATLIYFKSIRAATGIVVATNLIRVALLFTAIQFYHSLTLVFLALVLVPGLEVAICLCVLPPGLFTSGKVRWSLIARLVRVGIPLGLTTVMGTLLLVSDGFMISGLLTVREYAIYRNGAIPLPFISGVYASISAIVLPELSQMYAQGDITGIVVLKQKAINAAGIIVLPALAFILFFHHALIAAYLSARYAESASVFLVINLLLLIRMNNLMDILILAEKTSLIFRYNLICAIVNLILNIVFIRIWGYLGAALSTTLSITLLALLLQWESSRALGKEFFVFYDFKTLGKAFGVSLLLSWLAYMVYLSHSTPGVLLILVGVYPVIIYAFLVFVMELIDPHIFKVLIARIPGSRRFIRTAD